MASRSDFLWRECCRPIVSFRASRSKKWRKDRVGPSPSLHVWRWGAVSTSVVRLLLAIAVINSLTPLLATEPVPRSPAAGDWPHWRGPNRDGTVVGFSIPDVWPESLDKQWSVDVGDGYSSPVVAGGRVYQLSRQGDEEHVRCLKLDSSNTVWHVSYPAAGAVHSTAAAHGIGPKSTLVVAREDSTPSELAIF